MKVYNIEDTRRFFEVISECSGDVEVVGRDGKMIEMKDRDVARVFEAAFSDAVIPEMVLKFSRPEDGMRVLSFLANMKLKSAA